MEHSCHQCAAAVDDGVAFCPQCNAPQIRVVAPVAGSHAAAGPAISYRSTNATGIQWSQALSAAFLAVVIAGVFTVITLGPVGLGILVAGALSVALYRRRNPDSDLTPGMGAWIGAASGALGFGVVMVCLALAIFAFHAEEQIRQALLKALQQFAAHNPTPEAQQAVDLVKTPEGFAAMLILGSIMAFAAFLLFSALGGTLAALLLRRKDRL